MVTRMNDESFDFNDRFEPDFDLLSERRLFAAEQVANQFAFKSEDFDPYMPLTCFDARHHDPTVGQFLATDPIEHDSHNVYRHVNPNTQNCTDPTGL
jgi:RHS repeat-associated protein